MHQCDDRNDSDDLKGIPSPSLSVCFENRTDEDVGRRKEDEVESPTFIDENNMVSQHANPQRKDGDVGIARNSYHHQPCLLFYVEEKFQKGS